MARRAASRPAAAEPAVPLPSEPGEYAVFNTSMGRIVVKLYEKESPITVTNFVGLARGTKAFTDAKTGRLAKRPFYNGLTFHRVIPGFMIQGGDPLGTGTGSGGVAPIKDEFDPSLKFDQPGRLAMANAGPNTGSCQFFITDSTPEYLNGKHTIFGQVVEGQDVVKAISNVPRNTSDKPDTPVVIQSLLIRRVAEPKPADASVKSGSKKAG
ncbi:MAG: peptidylprolyl isomerase [Acidobacteriota bacterium]|nr:peptidylprolyl isomerase [Acidobacteriota bacterium]